MNDATLVKKILAGNSAAGERFVTENYPRIYRLLRCLSGSGETALDLTQQTFARAWQSLASYQGRANLATWLHRIAYHEYTHWLRIRRDHLPLEAAGDIEDLREARGLDSILVSQALTRLPNEQREAFILFYMQEFSVEEVAQMLDVPSGTVKSRLFTARQRLRELLQAAYAPTPAIHAVDGESHILYSSVEGGHL